MLNIDSIKDGKLMAKILSKYMGAKVIYYLIDTGACFNFLSLELAKELGAPSIDYNDNINFASFDGTVSDTVGSILIERLAKIFIFCCDDRLAKIF